MLLDESAQYPIEVKRGLKDWIFSNPWLDSLVEVFITIAISNLAIIIAAVVSLLLQDAGADPGKTIIGIAYKAIKPTEIIVYIFGFIAPAIWIMFRHMRYWRHTAIWIVMLLFQFISIMFATIVFSLATSESLKNTELAETLLVWCFLSSLVAWYGSLVYQKKFIENPASQIKTLVPGNDSGSDILAALELERGKYE
jgi:hypothetical protein